MCGIAGILDFKGTLPGDDLSVAVSSMTAALAHRGPDGEGLWINGDHRCAFGHRRLSIIDVSAAGAQPMVSADGRYVVTFNGEIYNFRELRSELEGTGVVFRSHCDTEVLLEAFRQWGRGCLSHFDGMFAFALHDNLTGETLLARDPFGEKPLYYAWMDGRFVFASEIDGLRRAPGFQNTVSLDSVAEYLSLQYVDGEDTIYSQVRKLRPGHAMVLSANGEVHPFCFFEFRPGLRQTEADLDVLTDELEDILTRSLKRRLIADVPLGAFLSGGVDSSLVVALITKRLGRPLQTFSIGFAGSEQSEHQIARRIAEHLGTEHHERVLTTEALALSRDLGGLLDEPNADTSCLPSYLLARFAREHVTVAISGDGGDEMFGGYGRYHQTLLQFAGGRMGDGGSPGDTYYSDRILVFPDDDLRELLGAVPSRLVRKLVGLRGEIDRPEVDLLHRMRKSDVEHYMPGAVLAKVDRMSMRHGLEVRTPFLCVELARFAEKLGSRHLVLDGRGKVILKRLACRYIPTEIVNRPKSGFGLPTDLWGEPALKVQCDNSLFGPHSAVVPFVPRSGLNRFQTEPKRFRGNRVYQLWSLYLLHNYLEKHGCKPELPPLERWHSPIVARTLHEGRPVAVFCREHTPSWVDFLPAGSVVIRVRSDRCAAPEGVRHWVFDWVTNGDDLPAFVRQNAIRLPRRLLLIDTAPTRLAAAVVMLFSRVDYIDGTEWLEYRVGGDLSAEAVHPPRSRAPLWYDVAQQEVISYPTGPRMLPGDESVGQWTGVENNDLTGLFRTGVSFQRSTPSRSLQLMDEVINYMRDKVRERVNCRRFLRDVAADRAREPAGEGRAPRSVLLFTNYLGAGGAERQLCNLAAGLVRAGDRVTILTIAPASERSRHYAEIVEGLGVPITSLHEWTDQVQLAPLLERSRRSLEILDNLPRVLRNDVWSTLGALQRIKPDAVHCFLDNPNIIGGLAGVLAGVPRTVLSFRNVNPTHFGFRRSWHREYYRWLIASPRIVLSANSPAGRRDYASWLRLSPSAIHLVPNGLDLSRFAAAVADRAKCRQQWGLGESTSVIAGVFRFSEEKRPWMFLELVARIRRTVPDLQVLIAGEGSLELKIRRQIQTEGLGDCVRLLGRVAGVASVMKAADVVVLTSEREGTPNVLLEAQSLGIPVVATEAGGGSSDAVRNGETGYIVGNHDLDGLVRQTHALLLDPDLRQRQGLAGAAFVARQYSIEQMVSGSRRLYQCNAPRDP